MNEIESASSDNLKLAARMESVRSDERGSVTLLAGMMVFLVSMFGIVAMDTNMAIHNRIVAQNAVDAAADSAALWQARFCNIEQQLNNLHYTVDEALGIAEGVSSFMCAAAIPLEVIKDIPFCEWAYPAWIAACVMCDLLPGEDEAQHVFYDALVGKSYSIQEDIADAAPFLVFANANACAYGSGANTVLDAASQTFTEAVQKGVSMIPGVSASSLQGALGSIDSIISSTVGQIPIYAFPLDPTSLELYVNPTNNNSFPLNWPTEVPEAGNIAGEIGCAEAFYPDIEDTVHNNSEGDSRDNSDGFHPTWGWADQYEFGNPGYMTWIAGVTNRDELLHLGSLSWLNGGMKVSGDYNANGAAVSKLMYTGGVNGNSGGYSKFQIPAFLAIASSQVEGTPVIEKGNVDAKGYLIKVYIPTGTDSPGTGIPFPFTIYH